MSEKPRHPMQPMIEDKDDGTLRFKSNAIVRFLLDAGPYDMNKLALMPWSKEDREQFAQLIGYSVDGFQDLPYVSKDRAKCAQEFVEIFQKTKKALGKEESRG
jgi:hypothetical protein